MTPQDWPLSQVWVGKCLPLQKASDRCLDPVRPLPGAYFNQAFLQALKGKTT